MVDWGWKASFGRLGMGLAKDAVSTNIGRGAIAGAALGGAYGTMSSDSSILGGAIRGSVLGAGFTRYGGAGFRRAKLGYKGIGTREAKGELGLNGWLGWSSGFAKGVYNKGRQDTRNLKNWAGSLLTGNQPKNPI